jgi:hypothetical protein
MLLGGLRENLESIHETEDEIRHKAIQTALFQGMWVGSHLKCVISVISGSTVVLPT